MASVAYKINGRQYDLNSCTETNSELAVNGIKRKNFIRRDLINLFNRSSPISYSKTCKRTLQ